MNPPRFELRFKVKGRVIVRFRATKADADKHQAFLERQGYQVKVKEKAYGQ